MSIAKCFRNWDLSKVKEKLFSKYKYASNKPGRPPHDPVGMMLCFLHMFVRNASYRDYESFLKGDKFWRRMFNLKSAPDHTCFSDFIDRIGIETFYEIFNTLLYQLVEGGIIDGKIQSVDSTIIRGHPKDNDARWTIIRGKPKFGYKIHLVVCSSSELPIAIKVTPANIPDNIVFPELYEKASSLKPLAVIVDPAYDDKNCRKLISLSGANPYIKPNMRGVRIKPTFSQRWKKMYNRRSAVERVYSRLKNLLGLSNIKVRGIKLVTIHVLLACIAMLLIALIGTYLNKSVRAVRSVFR
jgi:transposase